MRLSETELLASWLTAGGGVPVSEEPDPILVQKRYLIAVEGGYALTPLGARQAARRVPRLDSPEGREGEV